MEDQVTLIFNVGKCLNLVHKEDRFMSTPELKLHIHKIVDGIQNEQLLKAIYDFLKIRESQKSGKLWSALSDKEKQEVLLAYEESENPKNLVSREKVFNRAK